MLVCVYGDNMIKKKETIKQNTLFYFALFLIFAFLSVGIVTADTSVVWTKEVGNVLAADMAEDGSIVYAAIADGANSTLYVYDSQGTEQNTFSISGNVEKTVCTADGSIAALYTDSNVVYYINDGSLTWTKTYSAAITDIDISNAGSVLVVQATKFHKYNSDGSDAYDSSSGTYSLGILDPNNEFAIVSSGGNNLNKYILTTTDQYWGKVNNNTFNTAFQNYQNLLVLYTNPSQTEAVILSNTTLNDELWDQLSVKSIAISDESLNTTEAYNYYNSLGAEWSEVNSSAGWSARNAACSWVVGDKIIIGGGFTGSSNLRDVWISEDFGQTWTQQTASAGWEARRAACSWVVGDKIIIGGGISGNGFLRDVWISEDFGQTWTQQTASAGWAARYGACSWVVGDKIIIGGGESNSFLRDVWMSEDFGQTWTQQTASPGWSVRSAVWGGVVDDKIIIGGGYSGSSFLRDVWMSEDFGQTWTQQTASPGWTARSSACSWVVGDKIIIGGGNPGGSYLRDVWMSEQSSLQIKPSSTGQTYIFYNFIGSIPQQHTQTTYNNAVDFSGTYELRTKPTLSIYEYQASKTVTGAIVSISVSDGGDWLGTATASRVYHDQVTSSGFGTSYNTELGSEGTVYVIATANEAAMSIIGQGQYTDIYSQIAARVGTYTAGGDIQHVDIAGNALWATSGGSDGKMYLFSKDQSSNWYLEYSSDAGNAITALKIATSGNYILAGRTDGLIFYQQTSPSPQPSGSDFWLTLYVYKDSDSYRNAAVNVSVYTNNQWTSFAQGLTDSAGKYVVMVTAGQNYKFDIDNGQKLIIYQASPSVTSLTASIYSTPISSSLTYEAVWDPETNSITFDYHDSAGQTQSVTVRILRTDNWDVVYENTFTNQQSIEQNLPMIDDTVTYKVEMSAQRVSGLTRNTFFVSSSRDIVSIPLDQNLKNILFVCFLIFIAGLFSYYSAVRGPIVVAFMAVLFVYMGWLTIPWYWVTVAVVIAILAAFTQRR